MVCASALQRFLFVFCFDWLFQLVSIGSQYSCGRAQQSEFLLIVSREVKGEERCFQKCCSEVCHTILFALTLICLASLRFCCFQIIPLFFPGCTAHSSLCVFVTGFYLYSQYFITHYECQHYKHNRKTTKQKHVGYLVQGFS